MRIRYCCDAYDTSKADMRKPSVLFVCVHNAGSSQLAAALLAQHAMGRVEVRSAGSAPGSAVNPNAVRVLQEWGIDISLAQPKLLDSAIVQKSDVVITMGCGDAGPGFPGTRYEDWVLDDPAGQGTDFLRKVRNEIDYLVRNLLSELID